MGSFKQRLSTCYEAKVEVQKVIFTLSCEKIEQLESEKNIHLVIFDVDYPLSKDL